MKKLQCPVCESDIVIEEGESGARAVCSDIWCQLAGPWRPTAIAACGVFDQLRMIHLEDAVKDLLRCHFCGGAVCVDRRDGVIECSYCGYRGPDSTESADAAVIAHLCLLAKRPRARRPAKRVTKKATKKGRR